MLLLYIFLITLHLTNELILVLYASFHTTMYVVNVFENHYVYHRSPIDMYLYVYVRMYYVNNNLNESLN